MLTIRDIPVDAADAANPDHAAERIADWLDAQRIGARLDFRGVEHTPPGAIHTARWYGHGALRIVTRGRGARPEVDDFSGRAISPATAAKVLAAICAQWDVGEGPAEDAAHPAQGVLL